jgi:hypothetical protein
VLLDAIEKWSQADQRFTARFEYPVDMVRVNELHQFRCIDLEKFRRLRKAYKIGFPTALAAIEDVGLALFSHHPDVFDLDHDLPMFR